MTELTNTFDVTNVGKGLIEFKNQKFTTEYRPIKFFIKEDGSINDKPSLAILGVKQNGDQAIMQISSDMFRVAYEALKEIYEINKCRFK